LLAGLLIASSLVLAAGASGATEANESSAMVSVSGGSFVPHYGDADDRVPVDAFRMDVHPVTNADFFRFVSRHPRWQRERIATLFADEDYLSHWQGNLALGTTAPYRSPVTNVSWFAARAYCAAQDKRLPTLNEWEYAARATEDAPVASDLDAFSRRILEWYGKPSRGPLPEVGSSFRNYWGLWDMHGLVWEWVRDFNSVMTTGASRKDAGGLDRTLFCAAGSIGTVDPNDYAAFMRYALRGSSEARHAMRNLGFRCARDEEGDAP
jgi:formylglycine-generating enzyme required for sulfatase activity